MESDSHLRARISQPAVHGLIDTLFGESLFDTGAHVLKTWNRLKAFLFPLGKLLLIVCLHVSVRNLYPGTEAVIDKSQKSFLPSQPPLQAFLCDPVRIQRLLIISLSFVTRS